MTCTAKVMILRTKKLCKRQYSSVHKSRLNSIINTPFAQHNFKCIKSYFQTLGKNIGLLKDLMSYINYMLGTGGKAKDWVDAIHKALNFCHVFFL